MMIMMKVVVAVTIVVAIVVAVRIRLPLQLYLIVKVPKQQIESRLVHVGDGVALDRADVAGRRDLQPFAQHCDDAGIRQSAVDALDGRELARRVAAAHQSCENADLVGGRRESGAGRVEDVDRGRRQEDTAETRRDEVLRLAVCVDEHVGATFDVVDAVAVALADSGVAVVVVVVAVFVFVVIVAALLVEVARRAVFDATAAAAADDATRIIVGAIAQHHEVVSVAASIEVATGRKTPMRFDFEVGRSYDPTGGGGHSSLLKDVDLVTRTGTVGMTLLLTLLILTADFGRARNLIIPIDC